MSAFDYFKGVCHIESGEVRHFQLSGYDSCQSRRLPEVSGAVNIAEGPLAFMPDFEKGGGLIAAVAQDAATGEVLMLAWMNREA